MRQTQSRGLYWVALFTFLSTASAFLLAAPSPLARPCLRSQRWSVQGRQRRSLESVNGERAGDVAFQGGIWGCHRLHGARILSGAGETEGGSGIEGLKKGLDAEFLKIAFPAFVQFGAEPLASLVDTMYLGRLGASALGGAGVAISAQYAVSKLYNDPLLRTSISLVASGAGKAHSQGASVEQQSSELSKAVSSALLLAVIIGTVQAVVYSFACAPIIGVMGVGPSSDMYAPALSYLKIRALGTPGATLWLVVNGIFRGLGDTATPLKWALVFTGLNAILDPIFIFTLGMGCSGAAAGTAIAQYVALVPLLVRLRRKVGFRSDVNDLKETLQAYVKSGGLMLIRTVGKILTYAVCAREAALLGTFCAAAYNITFQLGTATTQICEAFAVAAQSLLARELEGNDAVRKRQAGRHIVARAVSLGGAVGVALSALTWFKQSSVLGGLTTDPGVLAAAKGIMPLVLMTQVAKAFAYPINGVMMGGMDWGFLMGSMWFCNLACCATVLASKSNQTIASIWVGLFLFMSLQGVTGLLRIISGTGVWRNLHDKVKKPE